MNNDCYRLTTRGANRLAAGTPDLFLQAPAGPRQCWNVRLTVRFQGKTRVRRVCLPMATPTGTVRGARDVIVKAIAGGLVRCHLDWWNLRTAVVQAARAVVGNTERIHGHE